VSPVGTKAGAATVVEVMNESAMMEPEEIIEVRLDRPFLYMIIDCEYNQPIFIGTVNQIG
jgi:serpin B